MKVVAGALLLTIAFLTGCAGLSESDCLALDWAQLGLEDGENGRDVLANDQYQDCSAIGVTADMDQYNQAYQEGLKTFCQAENGFEVGKSGYDYSNICPADLAGAFVREYEIGTQFYQVLREINAIEMAISGNQSTIDKLERGINTNNLRLSSGDLTTREEAAILQEIRSQESQINEYERKGPQLQSALLQRQAVLEELKKVYGK